MTRNHTPTHNHTHTIHARAYMRTNTYLHNLFAVAKMSIHSFQHYKLHLVRSWTPIGRFDAFQENEVVLCMDCVRVDGVEFLVMGTGIIQGESVNRNASAQFMLILN